MPPQQEPSELVRRPQLRLVGQTDRDIARQLGDGRLVRLRRGVYSPGFRATPAERHRALIEATLPLLHPDTVLSHASAAVLLGLPVQAALLGQIWTTRTSGVHGRTTANLVQTRAALGYDEMVLVGGHCVTSLARTASDLARVAPFEWGVIACDAALRAGLSREGLLASIESGRRRRGNAVARRVAAFADGASESPLESLSRVQMARFGLPVPQLQVAVVLDGLTIARSDFGWPDRNTVGEADGRVKYAQLLQPGERPEDVVLREKARDERIRQAGLWPAHWGWEEASAGRPMVDRILRAFEVAPRPRG